MIITFDRSTEPQLSDSYTQIFLYLSVVLKIIIQCRGLILFEVNLVQIYLYSAKEVNMSPILLLKLLFFATTISSEELGLLAELELTDMELQDDCENLGLSLKSSLISNDFSFWAEAELEHGHSLKRQSQYLKTFESDIPYTVLRNWTVLVNSGDALLDEKDWNELVSYSNETLSLMKTTKIHCRDKHQNCPIIQNVYETILENSKNVSKFEKSWSAWQNLLSSQRQKFPKILNLVKKAAIQNDQNDPKSYWEMLMEQESAYEQADTLWAEIQPLYLKLQNFVKTRLFKFYNISSNSAQIPVYLLGSNFGNDWSYVADIVLPHPLIYQNAKTYLKRHSVQDVYKLAENLIEELSLGPLGETFWNNSVFNMTSCNNQIISFCTQEHSELFTCDQTSWVRYLNAFENAVDIGLRNVNYLTLPRTNLRHSVITEAVKSLGSVLAITNMRHNGILDRNLFNFTSEDNNYMTELLLIALRVLPRLPYYLIADKWRLGLLENGFENIEESWWELRSQYQGVHGITNREADFLGDPYIISNKPYLSKFLGIILQFQLLQNYKLSMLDVNDNIASQIGADENFITMIHEISSSEWQNLVEIYYGSAYLSASTLLDFFQPLEEYLDSAPLEQESIPIQVEDVEREKHDLNVRKPKNVVNVTGSESGEPQPGHIHENWEEEPNPTMENIAMYVGLGLVGAVGGILLFVIGSKKLARRKRNNNRRFET